VRNGRRRCIGSSAGLLWAVALVIAGCGNSRTPIPNLSRPATPAAFIQLGWPKANVGLRVPGNWNVRNEKALVAAARRRDPRLRLIRAGVSAIGSLPAIELDAFEQIAGHTRRVRSTHVFTATSELVLDEYAPPGVFHTVDHAVVSPVKRSLRLLTSSSA
jgi:hypothetical protein